MKDAHWRETFFDTRLDVDIPPLELRVGDTVRIYPEGPVAAGDLVLVEINADLTCLTHLRGAFRDRVVGLAVKLAPGG